MRISYQAILRALGEHLDELSACRIKAAEETDGFIVHLWENEAKEPMLVRFPYAELLPSDGDFLRYAVLRSYRSGGDEATPQTYRNLLRALGYELDQVGASNMALDELHDGFLVTYIALEPAAARTCARIFGPKQMLLEEALTRRDQGEQGLSGQLKQSGRVLGSLFREATVGINRAGAGELRRDEDGPRCPFLSIAAKDSSSATCSSRGAGLIDVNPEYVGAYCLATQFGQCSLFRNPTGQLQSKAPEQRPVQEQTKEVSVAVETVEQPVPTAVAEEGAEVAEDDTDVVGADWVDSAVPDSNLPERADQTEPSPAAFQPNEAAAGQRTRDDTGVKAMIEVRQVTLMPTATGNEVQADMMLGRRKIVTSWPVEEEAGPLRGILERLLVRVERVAFMPAATGGHIELSIEIGGHTFTSTWPINGEHGDLQALLETLQEEIGRDFMKDLHV